MSEIWDSLWQRRDKRLPIIAWNTLNTPLEGTSNSTVYSIRCIYLGILRSHVWFDKGDISLIMEIDSFSCCTCVRGLRPAASFNFHDYIFLEYQEVSRPYTSLWRHHKNIYSLLCLRIHSTFIDFYQHENTDRISEMFSYESCWSIICFFVPTSE